MRPNLWGLEYGIGAFVGERRWRGLRQVGRVSDRWYMLWGVRRFRGDRRCGFGHVT